MRLLPVIFSLLASASAHAAAECSIYQNSGDGVYDLAKYEAPLPNMTEQDETQLIYIKPDGSVTALTWKEVKDKPDFSDLDRSTFFTFRLTNERDLSIGYGDVDISRQEVRRLIVSVQAENRAVLWAGHQFAVICETAN